MSEAFRIDAPVSERSINVIAADRNERVQTTELFQTPLLSHVMRERGPSQKRPAYSEMFTIYQLGATISLRVESKIFGSLILVMSHRWDETKKELDLSFKN